MSTEYEQRLAAVCAKHGLDLETIPAYLRPWLTALGQCLEALPRKAPVERSGAVPAVTDAMASAALASLQQTSRGAALPASLDDMRAALNVALAAPEPQQAACARYPGCSCGECAADRDMRSPDEPQPPDSLSHIQHSNRLAAEHAQEQLLTRSEWEALAAAVPSPHHGDAPVAFVVRAQGKSLSVFLDEATATDEAESYPEECGATVHPCHIAPVSAPAAAPHTSAQLDEILNRCVAEGESIGFHLRHSCDVPGDPECTRLLMHEVLRTVLRGSAGLADAQKLCGDNDLLRDYMAYANAPDSGFADESMRLHKLNERAQAMGLSPPKPEGSVT